MFGHLTLLLTQILRLALLLYTSQLLGQIALHRRLLRKYLAFLHFVGWYPTVPRRVLVFPISELGVGPFTVLPHGSALG